MMDFIWILIILAAVAGAWLWFTYNALVKLNIQVDSAWSDITVQLKRRADLIPSLVEAVKGYAKHEKETFEKVTEARSATLNAGTPADAEQADNMLTGALKSLFAVAEAYPLLQASQNFLQLQTELADTEDKIMASRRFYNGSVRDMNQKILQFPQNIIANNLGFTKRDFFEVEESERLTFEQPPQVSF
jgi:LemA protein